MTVPCFRETGKCLDHAHVDSYTLVSDARRRRGDDLAPINPYYQQHTAKYPLIWKDPRLHRIASFQMRIFSWTKRTVLQQNTKSQTKSMFVLKQTFRKDVRSKLLPNTASIIGETGIKVELVQHTTAMAKQHPASFVTAPSHQTPLQHTVS